MPVFHHVARDGLVFRPLADAGKYGENGPAVFVRLVSDACHILAGTAVLLCRTGPSILRPLLRDFAVVVRIIDALAIDGAVRSWFCCS